MVEPVPLRRDPGAGAEKLRPWTLATHAGVEIGVVVAAAAQGLDGRHYLGRAVGEMCVEPGAKQWCDFVGQADGEVEATERTGLCCALHDVFDLMIGDRRDDRGERDEGRDACSAQLCHGGEAAFGEIGRAHV